MKEIHYSPYQFFYIFINVGMETVLSPRQTYPGSQAYGNGSEANEPAFPCVWVVGHGKLLQHLDESACLFMLVICREVLHHSVV